jgi:hypothetical protein
MGWFFNFEEANLVAYLTTPSAKTPEVTYAELSQFFTNIRVSCKDGAFISSYKTWPARIEEMASNSSALIPADRVGSSDTIEPDELNKLLDLLREEFQGYSFYALAVFDPADSNFNSRLEAFMKNGAYSSEGHGLFLITDKGRQFDIRLLDPFPPIQLIAKHPGNVPGVVFWNKDSSTFAHIADADELLRRLLRAVEHSEAAVTDVLETHSLGEPDKRILHLSDLHFGTKRATALQEFLISSIAGEAKKVDRIVVTGDLFDHPTAEAMDAFRNFRSQLERITDKDVIVVPGNHDESYKGNRLFSLGTMNKQVVSLEWTSLEIDSDMRCAFFAFDSAVDAKISAQGVVSEEQLIRVGTMYQTRLERKPDLANYLLVALIHHHPFSWKDTEPKILGFSIENLLYLDKSEQFLRWCVDRKIPLILHGHKHVPRHVREYIRTDGYSGREITSIGCGSSLGAEDGPLSYNILSWHPQAQRWSAAFFVDSGKASGFRQKYMSVSNAQSN